MTIAQAERFYEQDTKDYEIEKNKDFLNWLKASIKDGYHCFMETEELQELINNIVNWYEIKYPEREMEFYEGIRHFDFENMYTLSKVMDTKQLMYRLPRNQLNLIECGYRAKGWGQYPIYENDELVGLEPRVSICINRKRREKVPYFLLQANCMTGEVIKNYSSKDYVNFDNIILDELLLMFNERYKDELDFIELKESVYNHNVDIVLRNKILQLVALKLLYSVNTIPERGYERSKKFINEFNKELNLTLSTEEIDEIMRRDYANKEKLKKTFVDENDEKASYDVMETSGLKRLVKRMTNKNSMY